METIFLLAFWGFLLGTISLSWRAGDREDRRAILAICSAALATGVVNYFFAMDTALALVLLIDLALLSAMAQYALQSERHWPIWFAGIQTAICFFSMATLYVPMESLRVDLIAGLWAMAALLVMTVGLLRDATRYKEQALGQSASVSSILY